MPKCHDSCIFGELVLDNTHICPRCMNPLHAACANDAGTGIANNPLGRDLLCIPCFSKVNSNGASIQREVTVNSPCVTLKSSLVTRNGPEPTPKRESKRHKGGDTVYKMQMSL